MTTLFRAGQEVAVVHRTYAGRKTGEEPKMQPRNLTKVLRITAKCVFTQDGRCWAADTGMFKDTPRSRPESVMRISFNMQDITQARIAVDEAAKAKKADEQRKREREAWLNRPDVKLARQLATTICHTEQQVIDFWLALGEQRLASLVEELTQRGAFTHLK
jgi:hypothetical protein